MSHWKTISLVLCLAPGAHAKPQAPPETTPIDRALANTRRYVTEHSKDVQGHFVLGRLHLLRYGGAKDAALSKRRPEPPSLELDDPGQVPLLRRTPVDAMDAAELDAALSELQTAAQLDPKEPRVLLSLAWALAERAAQAKDHNGSEEALAAYQRAFDQARQTADESHRGLGPELDVEAGEGLIDLLGARTDGASKKRAAEVKAFLDHKRSAPRAISPVVVLFDGSASLAPHVDPKARLHFDLDGLDTHRAWPWLRPTAGFLVWDPDACGHIRDGRQLLGNVTWWGLWRTGYEPLAALDDDGDGSLSGDELAGLGLWVDRDGDGVSEPGEVTDLRSFGVVRLTVAADGLREGVAWQRAGVTLRDGRTLSTFDWLPLSVPEPSLSAR